MRGARSRNAGDAAFWGAGLSAGARRVVLLAEGFGAVAVQLCAIRALAPGSGMSVGATSVVTCAFVAGLAGGYATGAGTGRRGLRLALLAAGAVTAVALQPEVVRLLPVGWGGVWILALAAVAPAGYCMGRCVVGIGATGAGLGTAFALSTVGNLVAVAVVPFVGMRYGGLGTAAGLAGAGLLFAAAVAGGRGPGRVGAGCAAVAALVLGAGLDWRAVEARIPPPAAGVDLPVAGRAVVARAAALEAEGATALAGPRGVGLDRLRVLRAGMAEGDVFAVVWHGGRRATRTDRLVENTVRRVFGVCDAASRVREEGGALREIVCTASVFDGRGAYTDRRSGPGIDAGWSVAGEGEALGQSSP